MLLALASIAAALPDDEDVKSVAGEEHDYVESNEIPSFGHNKSDSCDVSCCSKLWPSAVAGSSSPAPTSSTSSKPTPLPEVGSVEFPAL